MKLSVVKLYSVGKTNEREVPLERCCWQRKPKYSETCRRAQCR